MGLKKIEEKNITLTDISCDLIKIEGCLEYLITLFPQHRSSIEKEIKKLKKLHDEIMNLRVTLVDNESQNKEKDIKLDEDSLTHIIDR